MNVVTNKFRFPISYQFFSGFFIFGIFLATIIGFFVYYFAYRNYYLSFKENKELIAKLSSSLASGKNYKKWTSKEYEKSDEYRKYSDFIQEIVSKDKTIAYLFTIYFNEDLNEFQYTSSGTISEDDAVWIENWSIGLSLQKKNGQWDLYSKGNLVEPETSFHINNLKILYKSISDSEKKLVFSEEEITRETILIEGENVFYSNEGGKKKLKDLKLLKIDEFKSLKEDPLQFSFIKKGQQDILQGSRFYNNRNFRNDLFQSMQNGLDNFNEEFSEFNFGDFILANSVIYDESKKPVGQVVLKITKENLKEFQFKLIEKILFGILASIPVSVFIIFAFSNFFSKPIAKLKAYASTLSRGDFQVKIKLNRNDEFSDLASSMNFMAAEISDSRTKLEHYAESLEIEVKERTEALTHTLEEIYKDLHTAKKIQNSILPRIDLLKEKLDLHTIYLPMVEVGGDFFDIHYVNKKIIRFFIADATGHGIQASLITMAIKTIYESIKSFDLPPNEVLGILNNQFIYSYESLNTYFTAGVLDLHLETGTVAYSGGGHPYPILVRADKTIENLKTKGTLLGAVNNMKFGLIETKIDSTCEIYIFTDGVFEEWNDAMEEFGVENLEMELSLQEGNLQTKMENTLHKMMKFIQNQPVADDISFIGFKIKA